MHKLIIAIALTVSSLGVNAEPASRELTKPGIRSVSSGDLMQWGVGLLFVLVLFFICVWAVRKMSGMTTGPGNQMRVVGGLTLGMREKIVLLEVGQKQLVLGITPGRIKTLLVLEGDDCLGRNQAATDTGDSGFSQKLMQVMKGRTDA